MYSIYYSLVIACHVRDCEHSQQLNSIEQKFLYPEETACITFYSPIMLWKTIFLKGNSITMKGLKRVFTEHSLSSNPYPYG